MESKADTRTNKRIIGDSGEDIVCTFLMKQGFKILDRNYLKPYGELDIVGSKDGKYHFIEVKTVSCEMDSFVTRRTSDRYRPEDNVHAWKLRKLGRVIQAYLLHKKLFDADWQFDVALVYLDSKTGKSVIEMLEDIIL